MRKLVIGGLAVVLAAVVSAGCGGSKSSSTTTAAQPATTSTQAAGPKIAAPAAIESAGKIVWCSDVTYPPEEFFQGTKPVGSDIDIANGISSLLGVKAEIQNTGFDGIIAALLGDKCDAIISGMNDTPERAKQVDFVDYLSVGQSLMVKKGNPKNISNLNSLAGLTVSVEVGTTNKDFLTAANKKLSKKMDIVTFPKDTDAANALKTGKVDAYFGDSPVVAYYIEKDPASFAFAGSPINPIPVGIALRKNEGELKTAISKAVDTMYADGSMTKILAKWHMSDFALKK
ncbi:MAG TPA: ABC transporter substrate-binding protein [Gaiellaceae bacterium]